jgi:hypothetical protein
MLVAETPMWCRPGSREKIGEFLELKNKREEDVL